MAEVGPVDNRAAANLRRNRAGLIGLVTNDPRTELFVVTSLDCARGRRFPGGAAPLQALPVRPQAPCSTGGKAGCDRKGKSVPGWN